MRSLYRSLSLSGAIVALLSSACAGAQTAKIAQGSLKGAVEDGAEVFKNIPFAAAPVEPLRWKPPVAAKGWTGMRDATAFGPACVQPKVNFGGGAIGVMMGDEGSYTTSEDCLNLNVRRPAGTKAGARLPVMVWIYGGGFNFGRNSQRTYTGTALVNRGVILVTPNYRLGALGFLAHPDLSSEDANHSSGNYGALDSIAALKWVKANIASLGGDPNNVTIFGESAGGAMVGYLSGSPLTKGLFNRAISQSGVFFGPQDRGGGPGAGASDTMLAQAEQAGAGFLKNAGVATIAEARALPAERVLAAAAPAPGRMPVFFRPNVDGWFLPKLSYELLRDGAYNSRPVLVGTNNDEGVLFAPQGMPAAQFVGTIKAMWAADADKILAAYPAANDAQALRSGRDLQRDSTFAWSAWTWGRLQRGAPVYIYNFDHRPPFPKNPQFDEMGAPHAADLPYVFGTLNAPQMAWADSDRAISKTMIDYWTNFAKTGNPNGSGVPRWDAYAPGGDQSLHFGPSSASMGPINALEKLNAIDTIFAARRARYPRHIRKLMQ